MKSPASPRAPSLTMKLLLFVGLPLTLLFVLYIGYRWRPKTQLESVLEELRSRGLLMTVEELERTYPHVPDAENGALLAEKAFEEIPEAYLLSRHARSLEQLVRMEQRLKRAEAHDAYKRRIAGYCGPHLHTILPAKGVIRDAVPDFLHRTAGNLLPPNHHAEMGTST